MNNTTIKQGAPMHTVPIYRMKLPKPKLLAMGDAERRLLLVLGHASNELSTLQRLVLFSLQPEYEDEIRGKVAVGRANVVIRLLAGKIWETHELVKTRIHNDRAVATKYVPLMMDGGKAVYERLKKSWGTDSGQILASLRNTHSFHFPQAAAIDAAFDEIEDDEVLEMFLCQHSDGTFYHFAELVFSVASTQTVKRGDFGERLATISKLIVNEAAELVHFIQHFTGTLLEHTTDVLDNPPDPEHVEAEDVATIGIAPISLRPA